MLGERIRRRRRDLDLTQEQLAAATGLKQFHISRIESGDIKDVLGETLKHLALALHVTTDSLLGIERKTRRGTEDVERQRPRQRRALVEA
jgi:transcriptional regulator with XRE-family HTH domain